MDFYLRRLQDALASATEGMTTDMLSRRPGAEKWCAAEILEHLYLTYTGTIRGFEKCLAGGKPLARTPTLQDRARTLVVVGLQHLPAGRKAPANATPRGMAPEQILSEISTKIAAMDEVIARAEQRFGKRVRLLDHPVLGPLRGQEWRKFHWVHGQLHLRQLKRLRSTPTASQNAK